MVACVNVDNRVFTIRDVKHAGCEVWIATSYLGTHKFSGLRGTERGCRDDTVCSPPVTWKMYMG